MSITCLVVAQNNSIEGNVLLDKNNKPLSKAYVFLYLNNNKTDSTKTDKNGNFKFNELNSGDYAVEARYKKLTPHIVEKIILNDSMSNVVIRITLKKGINIGRIY